MAARTEPPTPRRLSRARHEGDSPVSPLLTQAASLLAVAALVPALAESASGRVVERLHASLEAPETQAAEVAWDVLALTAPVLTAGALAALAMGLVQTQGIVAFRHVRIDPRRLQLGQGLAHLLSLERLQMLLMALLGAAVAILLAASVARSAAPTVAATAGDADAGARVTAELARRLAALVACASLGLGAFDLGLRRLAWLKRLRMTRDEVERERKETEGDPAIRRARRSQAELELSGAGLVTLDQASLLVVERERTATALHYVPDATDDEPPRVIAQGPGPLARTLERRASRAGVPVVDDAHVAEALRSVPVGSPIPPELYGAVARLFGAVSDSKIG